MSFDATMLLNAAIPHDLSVRAVILIVALGLDALVGDPPWLWSKVPHPVVLFGRMIAVIDWLINRSRLVGIRLTGTVRRALGSLSILLLVCIATIIGGGLAAAASFRGMIVSSSMEVLLVAILLAGRSLVDHARAVTTALENGTVKEAQTAVSMMVGRNSETLDRSAISRATIESTAENFCDGVVAPALFYLVFGLPGIFAYKLVNTADSMVGYRSGQYLAYGWSVAKLDDFVNLIPARIAGFLIALAGPKRSRCAIVVMLRDARHHRSPNAGWPEAAMAAQLGLLLGGPRTYGPRMSQDLGMNLGASPEADPTDISRSVTLMWRASALFALLIGVITLF